MSYRHYQQSAPDGAVRERRRATPIPVPPPRVPPSHNKHPTAPNNNNNNSSIVNSNNNNQSPAKQHLLPPQTTASIHHQQYYRAQQQQAHHRQQYDDIPSPWINPRLYSKAMSVSRQHNAETRDAGRDSGDGETQAGGVCGLRAAQSDRKPQRLLLETQFAFSMTGHVGTSAQASAAAAFFARAAQKLNLAASSPGRRSSSSKRQSELQQTTADDGFCAALSRSPPALPANILRRLGAKEQPTHSVGKVKVTLRLSKEPSQGKDGQAFLSLDKRKKQVTLMEPSPPSAASTAAPPEDRLLGVNAPKMFAFDAIFTDEDSQIDMCSSVLGDVVHAVVSGSDGCVFGFGYPNLGKSHTMIGTPDSPGVTPMAIAWLFKSIQEQKQRTGARFSMRVSAMEVHNNSVHDLLASYVTDEEQSPGMYLRDDPLLGMQILNSSELRAPTAEKAAFYLDSAIAAKQSCDSHLIFSLHVYQYSVAGRGGVSGGRSRLHCLDLSGTGKFTPSAVGGVLLAIFNSQKHIPHRDQRMAQALKECLGSVTCHVAMVAHVSPDVSHYVETLATIQLASRIHRMRRRRFKFTGGSGGGARDIPDTGRVSGSSECPSSSEQSADTVIYMGGPDRTGPDETDGEHPPVYLPALNSGDNRCSMSKALRGSGLERPHSKSVPASPFKTLSSVPVSPFKTSSLSSVPPSPFKTASLSSVSGSGTFKASDGSGRGSPRKIAAGKMGMQSSKSSPARTAKSKTTSLSVGSNGEEQWVDGPRISRSRVVEARNLHMITTRETWVDGPMQPTVNGTAGATSYGFMDGHKQSMIQQWVENQKLQAEQQKQQKDKSSKERLREGERGRASGQEDNDCYETSISRTDVNQDQETSLKPSDVEDKTQDVMANKDTIIDTAPDALEPLDDENEEEMEIEIIEVEELGEPVLVQDSCLQVTEEDIALCMGQLENPLPEVDQEEHPLRILSEENLTIVSTFTDSLSIANDIERFLPRGSTFLHKTATTTATWCPNSSSHTLKDDGCIVKAGLLSRCQSLSVSLSEIPAADNSSVTSEPAYLPGSGSRYCDNCHMSMSAKSTALEMWCQQEHNGCERLSGSISSLRQPDGASNPTSLWLLRVAEEEEEEEEDVPIH
ncbi:kinesin-like protein CG14535 isoform X2 [Nilaparvata lugens]|uniref:kinesin-like protein CG14535 isoform X2 n=1 Tax=Nilaparvata lugens TaxID=108931 RepID=UPI00193D5A4D|nr:kinesin-like protein CG14535 isoform X2 [Nilaparvata lugens]XP_039283739.1 kinesin-like protein CG14535 isoform X2 [Nilaparvata lugens]